MNNLGNKRASYSELLALANEAKKFEKKSAISDCKMLIGLYGITSKELGYINGGSKSTIIGSNQKGYYKNPENGDTWNGVGRKPKWLKDNDEPDKLFIKI